MQFSFQLEDKTTGLLIFLLILRSNCTLICQHSLPLKMLAFSVLVLFSNARDFAGQRHLTMSNLHSETHLNPWALLTHLTCNFISYLMSKFPRFQQQKLVSNPSTFDKRHVDTKYMRAAAKFNLLAFLM